MPNLSELTDYEMPAPEPIPANIPRVYIGGSPAIEDRKEEKGIVQKVTDKLLGLNGEERYQLWPEKVVREGLSAAGDVFSGQTPQWGVDPVTGDVHTSPQMIEKAQAISALAGSGGLAGAEEGAVLNATPSLRPALKYKDKLYKGKPGQEHQDVIPDHLYSEFQDMAMKGEDISHYNFGFVNDKGHFLDREAALKYGIDSGLIDPQAGKFGALTSTLMADSSKPGTAIEAMAKADSFFSALEHNVSKIGQSKMTGDQWLGTLSNKPGVKPEELDWTGLKSFLQENGKASVTKEQIEQHLASNKVELKEVQKGEAAPEHIKAAKDAFKEFENYSEELANKYNLNPQQNLAMYSKMKNMDPAEVSKYTELQKNYIDTKKASETGDTKYHSYQLPGGENYREMLMTLPEKRQMDPKTGRNLAADQLYKSSHWDEPNILAHVRMNDRTMPAPEGLRLPLEIKNTGGDKPFKIFIKGETEPRASYKTEAEAQAAADKAPAFAKKELKSLHLEEIQSDWHQQGRDKGYQNPLPKKDIPAAIERLHVIEKEMDTLYKQGKHELDPEAEVMQVHPEYKKLEDEKRILLRRIRPDSSEVPDAPFKKTWHELALKRMLREAAEKGYDRLSWTPGEAQAARYDLSKSISDLTYNPKTKMLKANDKNGRTVLEELTEPDKISDFVGKEAAKKLLETKVHEANPYSLHSLTNTDLKIGGEGMKGFYDNMIPKSLEKIGKEHGVKVKQSGVSDGEYQIVKKSGDIVAKFKDKLSAERKLADLAIDGLSIKSNENTVHYIDLPQSLKDTAIGKGFPLFSSTHIFTPVGHDPFKNEKKK